MTRQQVIGLADGYEAQHPGNRPDLVETHISWVLLARDEVFKIKKPLHFSFLDFSTLEKRRYYCEQEVELNRRLAPDMYRGVVDIRKHEGQCLLNGSKGSIIDYAVWMNRMDETRQLDRLLERGEVSPGEMEELARLVADFHRGAPVVTRAEDWLDLYREFEDLNSVLPVLALCLGREAVERITRIQGLTRVFLESQKSRIEARKAAGFVRDGHGDLHCRNILMTRPPVIFDCIEFSEELRTLGVVSEIGLLCMDFERFGRDDLSGAFAGEYLRHFHGVENHADRLLFDFYKMYRANVRMKVTALAINPAAGQPDPGLVATLQSYFKLFDRYAVRLFAANP